METIKQDTVERLLEAKRNGNQRPIGAVRAKKYITIGNSLQSLAGSEHLDALLKDMKRVHALADKIEASKYEAWTKKDLRLTLKALWKVANNYDLEDSPKEVRWLKTNIARKDRKMPTQLLNDEDMQKMLKFADIKYRAIIMLLYEAGLRISELCALKKTDIEFVKEGAKVHVPDGTKTGARTILVMDCVPAIAAWLTNHPEKASNALIFTARRKDRGVGDAGIRKRIKEIAKDAGIQKRIYPHLFRHSAATRLAKHLTESQLKVYCGWTQESSMAATYVHLSGKDTDNAVLAMHNKPIEREAEEDRLAPPTCERCNQLNLAGSKMCCNCGLPFDKMDAKRSDIEVQERITRLEVFAQTMATNLAVFKNGTPEEKELLAQIQVDWSALVAQKAWEKRLNTK